MNILAKLEHPSLTKQRHTPHRWVPKIYGQKVNMTPSADISELLSKEEATHIQRVVGSFIYYARALDNNILTAVNEIATTQAPPTKRTKDATIVLMDYLYTHPEANIWYKASDMQLYVDLYEAYIIAPKAKSRIAGYFHLRNK